MLRLPPFTYLAPQSIAEAVRLKAEHGADAMFVAGGSDVYAGMKRGQFEPKVLVALHGIEGLASVTGDAARGFSIGACVTLARLQEHPQIRAHFPALAKAAGLAGSPQLRQTGTIGGNVCLDTRCNYYNQTFEWRKAIAFCMKKDGDICRVAPGSAKCVAVSSSDTAPVLCSLGAQVRLVGPLGERKIPIQDLYRDDGMYYLTKQPDEILTHIDLPPPDGLRCAYWKLRRRGSFDFSVLGVAVALRSEGETVREARIVLGGVGSQPRAATAAADLLVGRRLTPEVIDAAAEAAAKLAKPLDNTDLTMWYRKRMARVYIARALRELAGLPMAPAG